MGKNLSLLISECTIVGQSHMFMFNWFYMVYCVWTTTKRGAKGVKLIFWIAVFYVISCYLQKKSNWPMNMSYLNIFEPKKQEFGAIWSDILSPAWRAVDVLKLYAIKGFAPFASTGKWRVHKMVVAPFFHLKSSIHHKPSISDHLFIHLTSLI